MHEKIILPEAVAEDSDLFDDMFEKNLDVSDMDKDKHTLASMYARFLHYADVMKYKDDPMLDFEKYTEAQGLSKKLGADIDESWFRNMAQQCELYLTK